MDKPTNRRLKPEEYVVTGQEPTDADVYAQFLHNLTDVPESQPLNAIPINRAGIANQSSIIQIRDFFGKTFSHVPVTVKLGANLEDHRGVHMSRFEEVLFAASRKKYDSIDEFTQAMAEEIRSRQGSESAYVNAQGEYLHPRKTRKSEKISHDKVHLSSIAESIGDELHQVTGVRAYNMTACPCTKTHTKYVTVPALREMGLSVEQINKVLNVALTGTHTQRGEISLSMDKTSDAVTQEDIYAILDDKAHLVYELLKRPDEHDLVIRALQKPQFTEDVARDVALGAFEFFNEKAPDDTRVSVESTLNDSIHIHDVQTAINTSLGQIRKALSNSQ
jgi:MptA/FolE2 family GTP cyclohydrolase